MPLGEKLSYEFALSEAEKRDDQKAVAELERVGLPPHTVSEMLVSRKWVARFGGSFHGDLSMGQLLWAALRADETSWVDLIKFGQGNGFSLEHLWPETLEARAG